MKPDFSKYPDGLIPVVVQDIKTMRVLMIGYMNEEAWNKTLKEENITFFSRSKQRLWTKGESSGNFLIKKQIYLDCDLDCALILAEPKGPVCHTGKDTCFGETNKGNFLNQLEEVIEQRKKNTNINSYVASLFQDGTTKIAQKVGEEAVELVIESMRGDDTRFLNEAADLLFHFLILLQNRGYKLENVIEILEERHEENKNK
ncbi:MAG: bifunctional phosphoribosyl-AMP cyclohydrolase/phosphoribosyl-ATP diphosphatase HisIE [Bacteroidia bacterium]